MGAEPQKFFIEEIESPRPGDHSVVKSESPEKIVQLPEDKELIDKDFLNLEEGFRREGIPIQVLTGLSNRWGRTDAMQIENIVAHDVYQSAEKAISENMGSYRFFEASRVIESYPHITRALQTGYNMRKYDTPARNPDRKVQLKELSWYSTYTWEQWFQSSQKNPQTSVFYKEGILLLGDEAYELPTHKLNKPFYSAGGQNSRWATEAGGIYANHIPPVITSLWFSNINPRFREYLEATLNKVNETTVDSLTETHLYAIKRHGLAIPEDTVRQAAEKYYNEQIPMIKMTAEALQSASRPIEFSEGFSFGAYKDSTLIFMGTTVPVMPLLFFRVPKTDSPKKDRDLNTEYEQAMMSEYADPVAANYRWADLATAFRLTVGSAKTDYLLVDPDERKQAFTQYAQRIKTTNVQELKEIREARAAEKLKQYLQKEARTARLEVERDARAEALKNLKLAGSETVTKILKTFFEDIPLEQLRDMFPAPAAIFYFDGTRFETYEGGAGLRQELIQQITREAQSGIPTLIIGFEGESRTEKYFENWEELKKMENFSFMQIPFKVKDFMARIQHLYS